MGIFAAAMALLLVELGIAGVVIYAKAKKVDLYPYTPLFLLRQELEGPTVMKAFGEIERRHQLKRLSKSDQLSVAEVLLRRQQNLTLGWDTAFGDFLQSLRLAGVMDDAMYRRFAASAIRFERVAVSAPMTTSRDVQVYMRLVTRAGKAMPWMIERELRVVPKAHPEWGGMFKSSDWPWTTGGGNATVVLKKLYEPFVVDVKGLPVVVEVRWKIRDDSGTPTVLAEGLMQVDAEVEVVVRANQAVPISRPGLREEIEAEIRSVTLHPQPGVADGYTLVCDLGWFPETTSFDLYLVYGKTEVRVRQTAQKAGYPRRFVFATVLPNLVEPVEAVFRPAVPGYGWSEIRTFANVEFRSKVVVSTQPTTLAVPRSVSGSIGPSPEALKEAATRPALRRGSPNPSERPPLSPSWGVPIPWP